MFDNTVTLMLDTSLTHDVSIIDTDNGVTKRRKALGGGEFLDLTISHSASVDKPSGLTVDRHLVRVDHVLPDADPTRKPAMASAYLVIAVPRRSDITPAVADRVTTALFNRLLTAPTEVVVNDINTVTARLYSGES